MSDNDLIRRGDAMRIMSDGDDIVGPDYPEWFINRYATIKAIPAVQPTVKPLGADGVTIHPQDILKAAWRDDLGEEGLSMYARILSALDMQPTVSPDVAALVEAVRALRDAMCDNIVKNDEPHTVVLPDGSCHSGPVVDFLHALVGAQISVLDAALARLKGVM